MVSIGAWSIMNLGNGKVWIRHENGEGGEFDIEKLEALVAAFFAENLERQ